MGISCALAAKIYTQSIMHADSFRIIKNYSQWNAFALCTYGYAEGSTGADIRAPLFGPSLRVEKVQQTDHDSLFEDPVFSQWMIWFREGISDEQH